VDDIALAAKKQRKIADAYSCSSEAGGCAFFFSFFSFFPVAPLAVFAGGLSGEFFLPASFSALNWGQVCS
jgi:hypothetical protein